MLLLVGAESLGIPLPGETALITAGIYAGQTHRLSPWPIFARRGYLVCCRIREVPGAEVGVSWL